MTVAAIAAIALVVGTAQAGVADTAPESPADQLHRPLVHFTPEQNWMNDPNGMVYVDGTYHLFFQHNPRGTTWGNMSWGHATSEDLLTWTEQPIAIEQTRNEAGESVEDIFSGSVVVDEGNTSGFAQPGGPDPLVAIYTSAYTSAHPDHAGIQAQSLAYSLDRGQTWTKYEGNPVLTRDSANFRDPKVFRYAGPAGEYWVMVAVEATDHQVVLYRSDDLREWDYLSTFGPANSVAGIWECPDLFPLPVDGDTDRMKWVMVVNLNPGAVAGGSGGQYFVGEFDGVSFTSESTVTEDPRPEGEVFASFDTSLDGWQLANEPGNAANGPFGTAPATGALEGQQQVTGFAGAGLVNSFHGGDWPVGTMTSPDFTVGSDFVTFLIGGGRHPRVEGAQLANDPPAGRTLFDFELPDGQNLADAGWTLTGDFASEPQRNPSTAGGDYYLGQKRINTWEGGPRGDDNVGTLTSPTFEIDGTHVSFLVGGGTRTDGSLEVELVVDGEVLRRQSGPEAGALNWRSWDVADLVGRTAQLRIVDEATGGWGHLTVDHVVVGDEPARVRSDETTVNLVVDGEVVRTATGNDSETLDRVGWDVSEFAGRTARLVVIDNNRFGWGHLLLDDVLFSDSAPVSRLEGYDWLDWGRDYYAAVSYSGAPAEGRIMQGWMSNWDYANQIPTSSWRSSMSLPREVTLITTPDGPRLSQRVVDQVGGIQRDDDARTVEGVVLGVDPVDVGLRGDVARLDIVLDPGSASRAGVTVLADGDSGTHIGYDSRTERVFVDRRESGDVSFHPLFASIEDAPVDRDADGTVRLEVYLDRASVELFAADGLTTITDQVFPAAGADRISAWAEGGEAVLRSLTVTPLRPTMWQEPEVDDGSTAPPGGAVLSHDNGWDHGLADGEYTVSMNLWWGQNASQFRLYENGELLQTVPLDYGGVGAQAATVTVRDRGNGEYVYTGELVNSRGVTATAPVTVRVTQANPGMPVLSHDNWDRDGTYAVTANLWWGTNATSYRFLEDGVEVAAGALPARTPFAQRAILPVTGRAPGTHEYVVELSNGAGTTVSAPITVTVVRTR